MTEKYHFKCISCLLAVILKATVVTSYTTSSADSLYTTLTLGYNSYVRPSANTTVTVTFGLLSVNSLDVKLQQFSVTGWIDVSWTDSRFSWTPSSYSSITDMYLDTTNCWNPKITVDNSADGLSEGESDKLFKIDSSGTVTWSYAGEFTVYCSTDVRHYPYDVHECSISVKSLAYPADYVTLISGDLDTSQFTENSEWEMTSSSVSDNNVNVTGVSYSNLKFKLKMTRRHSTILVAYIVPLLLISFAGLFVFIIPAESNSKVGYTVAILIAELLLMVAILDIVPVSGSSVPVLGTFLLVLVIVNFLETFSTIVITKMFHNKDRNKIVTQNYVRFASVLFALTCYRHTGSSNGGVGGSPTNETECTSIESPQAEGTPPEFKHPLKRKLSIKAISPDNSFATSSKEEFRRARNRSKGWVDGGLCGCGNGGDRKVTWEFLSSAMDRMCFVLFLLFRFVVTIVFMLIISVSSS